MPEVQVTAAVDDDVHQETTSSVRVVELDRRSPSCGFHLTRSKWDPYPWVSAVDRDSPAELAGIRPGECVLEVNGEDVLGKRISEVADRVRAGPGRLSMLLWNCGLDPRCAPESLCCGPMPQNLQRLSACMSSILSVLECPICMDTIPPPVYQCDNGHLMCLRCRSKSEKCPVCRLRLNRTRSLLAEQIYNAITDVFDLRDDCENSQKEKIRAIFKSRVKSVQGDVPNIKVTQSHTNKFLARIIGKSSSVDNLSSGQHTGGLKSQIQGRRSGLNDSALFGANLKAKSLSTSEICAPLSASSSRAGSFQQLNGVGSRASRTFPVGNPDNGSSSCYGSFESLSRRCKDDLYQSSNSVSAQANHHDQTMYPCPYAMDCCAKIKGANVIRHFQECHDGPLMQYFQPKFRLPLTSESFRRDACYVIHFEEMIFFLRILDVIDNEKCKTKANEKSGNVQLWMWLLANTATCSRYQFRVQILGFDDALLLSVTSGVYSLEKVPSESVINGNKGIFLNMNAFQSSTIENNRVTAFLNVEIRNIDES